MSPSRNAKPLFVADTMPIGNDRKIRLHGNEIYAMRGSFSQHQHTSRCFNFSRVSRASKFPGPVIVRLMWTAPNAAVYASGSLNVSMLLSAIGAAPQSNGQFLRTFEPSVSQIKAGFNNWRLWAMQVRKGDVCVGTQAICAFGKATRWSGQGAAISENTARVRSFSLAAFSASGPEQREPGQGNNAGRSPTLLRRVGREA